MSKLTIPQAPRFSTELPSSGKVVFYRPFTVREESFLLQAKEVENEDEILDLIFDLLRNCYENVDPASVPFIDVEWMFLQLRKKSVGEEIEQNYRCLNEVDGAVCNGRIQSFVDLNKVEVRGSVTNSIILEFPKGKYNIRIKQQSLKVRPKTEIERIYFNVDCIEDPVNGLITKDDFSLEDFEDFVKTFTTTQYHALLEAIDTVATLYYQDELVCPKCGNKSVKEYKTLIDFFI